MGGLQGFKDFYQKVDCVQPIQYNMASIENRFDIHPITLTMPIYFNHTFNHTNDRPI